MNALVKLQLEKVLGPAPSPEAWGGVLGLIEKYDPELYTSLWMIDVAMAGALFSNDGDHTISWQIATRAKAGNAVCQALCAALNALSPNHCQNTLDSETLLQKLALRFT